MSAPADRSIPHPPLDPGAFARYAIHDRREILQLLNALVSRREPVTTYIDAGPWFVTKVLAISSDGNALVLDAPADEAKSALAANAAQLVCTTRLEKVNIQFTVEAAAPDTYDHRPALRAALPESILRLQRREFFRLPTPQSEPVTCSISHSLPDGRKKTVKLRILDISGGGLAIVVPPDELPFLPGMEFNRCHLELPDNEALEVGLKVRNLYTVEKPGSGTVTRAGCEFFGLSRQMMARIQRYMFRLERSLRT
ncbi:MAG TPA: flagellar brake protein [Aromatoleum sp.]|uniref:flagellar brake protein n=1 Tax=Aromatoleum sp. TaxID=2307007 RepID=UPI002B467A05|nr:flagellar brake protein [Aromatoleum sp.]HJV26680.1 flagellar brake protein [Aromatoleum sp.]